MSGAQDIGLSWQKTPFLASAVVSSDEDCPVGFTEDLVYDIWLGLEDGCFCQEGSALESTLRTGGCRGKAANSPYCRSRPPITSVVRNRINGFKVCGKPGGSNFLNAKRPRGGNGRPYLCPTNTVPCGGDEHLSTGNVENVLCVKDLAECPITSIELSTDGDGNLVATPSIIPDRLPLSSFKFSAGLPCISYTEEPLTQEGQFTDEYNFALKGCTKDDFLGTSTDARFYQVGDFSINQGDFEEQNFITDIFIGRYNRNDATNFNAIEERAANTLELYASSAVGWKLACEDDPSTKKHFSRKDAYDLMFKKTLNTQSENLRSTMFYGPLFVSILAGIMILMALIIAIQSFCRQKDCLMMMVSCSTNNSGFVCASTVITAFLFFYLLLFFEALNETNADIDFVKTELAKVNECLGPLDQINIGKIQGDMQSDQLRVYEMMLILLFFYIGGYCLCILPASVCLFKMRK